MMFRWKMRMMFRWKMRKKTIAGTQAQAMARPR